MCHVIVHFDVEVLITCFVTHSINRDKKGYNKGDGALIVGAFFRKYARESVLMEKQKSRSQFCKVFSTVLPSRNVEVF